MKTIRLILALAVVTLPMVACSKGSATPSAPTPVVANYAGTWTGNYLISGCTQSGGVALANLCGAMGQSMPYRLTLSQSGSSVTGAFDLGSVAFPSTGGTVGGDSSLQLTGNETSNGVTVIATWSLRLAGNALAGNITQVWTSSTLSGQATLVGTITSSSR